MALPGLRPSPPSFSMGLNDALTLKALRYDFSEIPAGSALVNAEASRKGGLGFRVGSGQ